MRKFFLALIFLVGTTVIAHADFKFGVDTYSNVGGSLIVNSLGDQVTPSTFGKLGVNDFIPENGVKNYLALEGYTQANDYNPDVTNSQFSSYYSDKPGDEYIKLTFAGLEGDPRKTQDVYVLTKEYERLSAVKQAERMDGIDVVNNDQSSAIAANTTRISNESSTRATADSTLQTNIDTAVGNSKTRDLLLEKADKTETTNRVAADKVLQGNIDNEATSRISGDNNLQTNIDTVANNSITRDNSLQNGINTEISNRSTADAVLHDNIANESSTRASADNALQNKNNEQDGRLNKLEQTQQEVIGEVRVFDSKKWQVNVYSTYSATRSQVTNVGVKVTFKMGQSYEDRKIEELNDKVNALMHVISNREVPQEEVRVVPNGTAGLKVVGQF